MSVQVNCYFLNLKVVGLCITEVVNRTNKLHSYEESLKNTVGTTAQSIRDYQIIPGTCICNIEHIYSLISLSILKITKSITFVHSNLFAKILIGKTVMALIFCNILKWFRTSIFWINLTKVFNVDHVFVETLVEVMLLLWRSVFLQGLTRKYIIYSVR